MSDVRAGLEPVGQVAPPPTSAPPEPTAKSPTLNVNGSPRRFPAVRRPPSGWKKWLLILGPGLIATSAGNDAGGIATYSSAGAQFGYQLIWVMLLLTVSFGVIQEMCSRLGAATGRGVLDLIRERFGLGWALLAVGLVLVANTGLVVSEFVGVAAATELLGASRYVTVPAAAALLWVLVMYASYPRVEKIFLVMTLVFFVYPVAAFMGNPDWSAVARGAFVPSLSGGSEMLYLVVALVGTTITPFMQIFQTSSMVERGTARRHYGPERVDAYVGALFSNLMSIAMIIATAATLHVAGHTQLESAADAATALEPVVGSMAKLLFAVGLLGATLLAACVVPLATAFAVTEVFGLAKGIDLDFRRAPVFYGLFTAMLAIGAIVALIPGVPVIPMMLGVQVLNGVLLPVMLFFLLRLANDSRLAGPLKNGPASNLLGWLSLAAITTAVLAMLATRVLG